MWEKNIGSVIVVDGSGTMVGIVTERDMLFAITKGLTGKAVPVSSITSKTELKATPTQSIATAVEMMRKGGVRHLPVVDKAGRPLGMISMRDALDITGPILKQVLRTMSKIPAGRAKLQPSQQLIGRIPCRSAPRREGRGAGPRAAEDHMEGHVRGNISRLRHPDAQKRPGTAPRPYTAR